MRYSLKLLRYRCSFVLSSTRKMKLDEQEKEDLAGCFTQSILGRFIILVFDVRVMTGNKLDAFQLTICYIHLFINEDLHRGFETK